MLYVHYAVNFKQWGPTWVVSIPVVRHNKKTKELQNENVCRSCFTATKMFLPILKPLYKYMLYLLFTTLDMQAVLFFNYYTVKPN